MKNQKGEITTLAAILIGALAGPIFNMFVDATKPEHVEPCWYERSEHVENVTDKKARWDKDCTMTVEQALKSESDNFEGVEK